MIIDKKMIPVSKKRQITIPVKFCMALGIESEVECLLNESEIVIRSAQRSSTSFSQEILNDLIDQGYHGEELKREFAKLSGSIKPAVKLLLTDVNNFAVESMKNYKDETDELFINE